jgi:hypothetical protein
MLPRRRNSSLPYTGPNYRVGGVITRTPYTVASNSPKVGTVIYATLRRPHRLQSIFFVVLPACKLE